MKTLGMIGGVGPESTIEYYRSIVTAYRKQHANGYPSIIINSIDLDKMRAWFDVNDLTSVIAYLLAALQKLASAGSDFAIVSAVTPHIVFDELERRSPLPLISIVETARKAAEQLKLGKVGLLGTRFTMEGKFFPDVFGAKGIDVVVPNDDEQTYIHDRYFSELVKGIILEETRARLIAIIERMKEQENIQGIIIGGTELSLILRDDVIAGLPMLDATKLHVAAIVDELV
jgi:aspartate racemase